MQDTDDTSHYRMNWQMACRKGPIPVQGWERDFPQGIQRRLCEDGWGWEATQDLNGQKERVISARRESGKAGSQLAEEMCFGKTITSRLVTAVGLVLRNTLESLSDHRVLGSTPYPVPH